MNYAKEVFAEPKVSVIVPAYNVEDYIGICLDSILKQSLKDIEVIVINDGSQDKTPEIISQYPDKRITVINQENLGPSAARNRGIEIARGDYIAFIDADDWISEKYLENLYNTILDNKCDIACASVIRKGKNKTKYRFNYKEIKQYFSLEEKIKVCRVPDCCYVCGKLFDKNLVKRHLFKNGVFFEDMLWLPRVLKDSISLVTVPDIIYYYRINKNSIVKKIPSQKTQKDAYNAKKYIVKFFDENGLELNKKERNITKCIKYLYKIPLIKIKEQNYVNTCYLFSFLPVLKYRDFDSHYIFKLFNIRICFRHKSNFEYTEASAYGLNEPEREKKIIVSLTSHPARIKYVSVTLNTLLQQTFKPDRIILWLAQEEFKNKENDLPEELLRLKKYGLEIKWCSNLLSYKKIVPALREFPNDIIVTADDDLYYEENWLEGLYIAYLKNPNNIYVKRAVKMQIKDGKIMPEVSRDKQVEENFKKASFANQLMGGSGCLFPPNCLYKDIFDTKKFLQILPTHDDIYLWVMAILKGTKIEVVHGFEDEMLPVDGTIESGLCKINNEKGRGITPEEAFRRILKEYPEISGKLAEAK